MNVAYFLWEALFVLGFLLEICYIHYKGVPRFNR